jgi:hypothetical protein
MCHIRMQSKYTPSLLLLLAVARNLAYPMYEHKRQVFFRRVNLALSHRRPHFVWVDEDRSNSPRRSRSLASNVDKLATRIVNLSGPFASGNIRVLSRYCPPATPPNPPSLSSSNPCSPATRIHTSSPSGTDTCGWPRKPLSRKSRLVVINIK